MSDNSDTKLRSSPCCRAERTARNCCIPTLLFSCLLNFIISKRDVWFLWFMVEMPSPFQITTKWTFIKPVPLSSARRFLESPHKANVIYHTSTKALVFCFKWRRNIGEDEMRILSPYAKCFILSDWVNFFWTAQQNRIQWNKGIITLHNLIKLEKILGLLIMTIVESLESMQQFCVPNNQWLSTCQSTTMV